MKIGLPAVLIAAALATAGTACSNSSHAGKPHDGASSGSSAGTAATFYRNPVCRQFQQDLSAWKAAVAEPGDASTVLLNSATRPAWLKFGRQLRQLSHATIGGNNASAAARAAQELGRTATLVTRQGTEPVRQITSAQYQRTVTSLEHLTTDCTALAR